MRVLLAHNFYQSASPSGEDTVYRNERNLLQANNYDVIAYERFNDEIPALGTRERISLINTTRWSGKTYNEITALIRSHRPDVAHFHNTFPLISPSAYGACHDAGVPVVQSLHNYRLICPGALLYRNGKPCEDCIGSTLAHSLVHRCYRNSFTATATVSWMLTANRKRNVYSALVDRYIAPSNFLAAKMVQGGLPEDRITVKHHFVPEVPARNIGKQDYIVYVGRLSAEKGVNTLFAAWEQLHDIPLYILGDGSLHKELEDRARQQRLNVRFLGFAARQEVFRIVGAARALVMPSECYEVFGLSVIEAYACGTPVIAARIGGLQEIVQDNITGYTFEAGNPDNLARQVKYFLSDSNKEVLMQKNARDIFKDSYSAKPNIERLACIYEEVIHSFAS